MTDVTTISAALGSIKTALNIVKDLRESSTVFEKAELKLRLAEVMGSLAEAKVEVATIQEALATKDSRIAELEEAFAAKDSLVRQHDAYYRIGDDGKPHGAPICLRCWNVEHRQRPLVHTAGDHQLRTCVACKTMFSHSAVATLP